MVTSSSSSCSIFVLVGMFYGTYSIFLRAVFSSGGCLQPWMPANLLENVYVILLMFSVSVSATIHISRGKGIFTFIVACHTDDHPHSSPSSNDPG